MVFGLEVHVLRHAACTAAGEGKVQRGPRHHEPSRVFWHRFGILYMTELSSIPHCIGCTAASLHFLVLVAFIYYRHSLIYIQEFYTVVLFLK